jgi:hypothetical protein
MIAGTRGARSREGGPHPVTPTDGRRPDRLPDLFQRMATSGIGTCLDTGVHGGTVLSRGRLLFRPLPDHRLRLVGEAEGQAAEAALGEGRGSQSAGREYGLPSDEADASAPPSRSRSAAWATKGGTDNERTTTADRGAWGTVSG